MPKRDTLALLDAPTVCVRNRRKRTSVTVDGYNSASSILADVDLKECEVFGFTKGQFSLMELLVALLDKTGPAHIDISVWTAAEADLRDAYNFLDSGKILSLRLLIDRSFESRQPEYCNTLRSLFGRDCVRIARTHAKVALLTTDEYTLAVRTSMNLNSNPRFEQFEISDCPQIHGMIRGVFDEVWKQESEVGCSSQDVEVATDSPFADF